jgi:tetratricopeptide (TPR) repeat protein
MHQVKCYFALAKCSISYGQLGIIAKNQNQWEQAREYLLQVLKIFLEYQDNRSIGIALRNLARLWQASGDASLPATIAPILDVTPEEVEALFRKVIEGDAGETSG